MWEETDNSWYGGWNERGIYQFEINEELNAQELCE